MAVHLLVAQGLWAILPAYLSNVLATIVGGGPPIDGGRTFSDGRRVLGDGKTWRAIALAPVLATLATVALHEVAPSLGAGLTDFGPAPYYLVHAYAMALGALVGDLTASFVKRRLGKPRGDRWLGPDQYDFVLGAMAFGLLAATATMPWVGTNWFLGAFTVGPVLVILILTPAVHLIVNGIGYLIGLKEVPW